MALEISYYPGCTLKAKAKQFDDTTLAAAEVLGLQLNELEMWNCCGTTYSLAHDDLIHQIAPIRNLIRVRDKGEDELVTTCSMCYNTLKRANLFIKSDPLIHRRINTFLDNKVEYNGEIKVLHFLEVLKDRPGFDEIKLKVTQPLKDLRVACYYGCLLVRPPEVGLDDLENPTILEKVMTELGAEIIDDPLKTECCGSYQTVNRPDFTADLVYKIVNSMRNRGADVIVTSCPLCQYNLDRRQFDIEKRYFGFSKIPILYFTQLMALAFGKPESIMGFDKHYVDPRPVLRQKSLIDLI
ncbi:CoB--CoM heterodisulfide reductase iron-sulfur subunit B family protein [candidate division KSB1 bacterium]|nr:CoB--CoM heterodisulfide reductase iron-sulfur subunit B family protein [candidate division KSB1 bacterium]